MKKCSTCKNEFPATAEYFYRQSNKKDGLTSRCKGCHNTAVTRYIQTPSARKKRVGYVRKHNLRKRYKITPEEYDRLHAAQKGRCLLCTELETKTIRGKTYTLAVDHDHVTGKVRGLLCNACNRALGGLKDDPTLMRKAANYIESFRTSQVTDPKQTIVTL